MQALAPALISLSITFYSCHPEVKPRDFLNAGSRARPARNFFRGKKVSQKSQAHLHPLGSCCEQAQCENTNWIRIFANIVLLHNS